MATDEQLLRRWREGDQRAGEQLFDRHFDSLFRFFFSKAEDVAEDLTQETLLACVGSRDRIREDHRFRAFMFTIARRVLYAHYGKKRRRVDVPLGSLSAVDLSPGVTGLIAEKQDSRIFLEALRSLPLDYQIALELHVWESLTGPEIAAVVEAPEGTIRSRIRRARLQLEEKIHELSGSSKALQSTSTQIDTWAENVRELLSKQRGAGD
ncbi:MAG: RNA polymerase sigma factor [Nannocystales bacterium]